MTKDKSKKKKKKEQGKGKEEEVDEGIPLKTANEFRRTNRMEPLSKEQWEQRKAVIRGNNERLEKQLVQMKSAQTKSNLSDQNVRSNTSDTQLPSEEKTVPAQEAKEVEEEIVKNFQQIANLEYYEEQAQFDRQRAENENQTGLNPNLPSNSLPLTGMESNQTLAPSVDHTNQTLAPSVDHTNQTLAQSVDLTNQTSAHSMVLPNQTLAHSMALTNQTLAHSGELPNQTVAQSVLNKQDVLNMAQNNQVKKKRPHSLENARARGWEEGHDDLEDVLNGYTSPGGQTFRIHRDLIPLLIMSAAAEMPNRAALQAKQDAYDQVTILAQIELGKQMAAYEEQRKQMAAEHERHLNELKREHQRMVEESTRVREEYASTFREVKAPTLEEIESAQSIHHYQTLKEQMLKRERRLQYLQANPNFK